MCKKGKAIPKKVCIGICAIILAVIFIAIAASNRKEVINLNKYLHIGASGYDGYGTAEYSVDWDAVREKYEGKLHFTRAGKKAQEEGLQYKDPIFYIQNNVVVSLDKRNGLSNGDAIKYSWEIGKNVSKYINCDLKAKDGKDKVSNLTELEKFDPFDGLNVKFSGVSSEGIPEISYDGDELDLSDFDWDNTEGLRNGDKVTVYLSNTDMEYYADSIGKVPDKISKEYTVSGLDEYVTSYDSLTKDFLDDVKKEAEDEIYSYGARSFGQSMSMNNLEYAGYIFSTVKDNAEPDSFTYYDTYSEYYNSLYVIYKGDVSSLFGSFSTTKVYYPVLFANILKSGDSLSYDENCGIVGSTSLNDYWDTIRGYVNPVRCYSEIVDGNRDNFISECGDGFEIYSERNDIEKLDDISKSFKEKLQTDAKDQIESYIAKNYGESSTVDTLSLKGEYLLISKSQTNDEDSNKYIVVYSAKASNSEGKFKTTTIYFPVEYKGIVKLSGDEYIVTETKGILGESTFPDNNWYSTKGYLDGNKMYSDVITQSRDAYTYEVSDGLKEFGS